MTKNKNLIQSSHDVLSEAVNPRKFDNMANQAARLQKLVNDPSMSREIERVIGKNSDIQKMVEKYDEFMDAVMDVEMSIQTL